MIMADVILFMNRFVSYDRSWDVRYGICFLFVMIAVASATTCLIIMFRRDDRRAGRGWVSIAVWTGIACLLAGVAVYQELAPDGPVWIEWIGEWWEDECRERQIAYNRKFNDSSNLINPFDHDYDESVRQEPSWYETVDWPDVYWKGCGGVFLVLSAFLVWWRGAMRREGLDGNPSYTVVPLVIILAFAAAVVFVDTVLISDYPVWERLAVRYYKWYEKWHPEKSAYQGIWW